MNDAQQYKPQIEAFLRLSGVEIDDKKRPPKLRCPSPNHTDENPSAVLYLDSLHVYCPVCNETWDIFDVCGLLHGLTEFKDQKKKVMETLGGGVTDKRSSQKAQAKTKPPKVPPFVTLSIEEARKVYTRTVLQERAKAAGWGEFVRAWKYLAPDGRVALVDVRFEGKDEKTVISFWYDGKAVRTAGAPFVLYGMDKVANDATTPVLIVEGCKTAEAAEKMPGFNVVTWPGGGKKIGKIDWTPLLKHKIFIYPDDDQKVDGKTKKLKPWFEQPGYMAAIEIREKLPQSKIVKPLAEARSIKPDGADIVEALQVKKPKELSEYILKSREVIPPQKETPPPKNIKVPDKLPFTILGIADDGRAYFLGRHERMIVVSPLSITKVQLLNLANEPWWSKEFGIKGRIQWDTAIDFIVEVASRKDFDTSQVRGRGAWREKNGDLCYHDGKKTIGIVHPDRLYVRKGRKDIGITGEKASDDLAGEISAITEKLTFETPIDQIRLMAWIALAPFAGALPWRPAILLTGESGSGKSTIIDHVIGPLAVPITVSGGESTEAGVRQKIGIDATAIVIDEAETDTLKKKGRRDDLFSLMRQSTSDDAPIAAKGTLDGRGMSFQMRSMFLFAAVSPEVETAADDNRIFRCNLVSPRAEWAPIRARLKELITPENCAMIRARTWAMLPDIIHEAERFAGLIQDVSGKDTRYALAEGIFQAAYWLVWRSRRDMGKKDFKDAMWRFYSEAPPEVTRDENEELLDRLLDEKVLVDKPDRGMLSLREILGAVKTKTLESYVSGIGGEPYDLTNQHIAHLRGVAARYGLMMVDDGIAVAANHHEIMRILGKGRGYAKMFFRHAGFVERDRVVRISGKGRRCVIINEEVGNDEGT